MDLRPNHACVTSGWLLATLRPGLRPSFVLPQDPTRRSLLLPLGAVILMVVAGLTTFLFSLRGAEETMVPDVEDVALLEAMLSLQERGLVARIEVRFSADPGLAGRVMSQAPPAGTLVRADHRVRRSTVHFHR